MNPASQSGRFRFLPGRWSWRSLLYWFVVILALNLGGSIYVTSHPFTGRLADSRNSLDSAIVDITEVEMMLKKAVTATATLDRQKRIRELTMQLQRSSAAHKCATNPQSRRILEVIVQLSSKEAIDASELADLSNRLSASRTALANVKSFLADRPK